MTSVWLVERGDYSDYHVVAVFSSQEQAKEFCDHYSGDGHYEPTIREYVLDKWEPSRSSFHVTFDLSGNILNLKEEPYVEELKNELPMVIWREGNQIEVTVDRGPKELATKIASEAYLKIRSYLDEALTIVERADWKFKQEYPNWKYQYALDIAYILSGMASIPTGPMSSHQETVVSILQQNGALAV